MPSTDCHTDCEYRADCADCHHATTRERCAICSAYGLEGPDAGPALHSIPWHADRDSLPRRTVRCCDECLAVGGRLAPALGTVTLYPPLGDPIPED